MKHRIWFGGPAAALLAMAAFTAGSPLPVAAAPLSPLNVSNPGQAGYEVTNAPASASATATFVVPALTCTATNTAMAPGAWIFQKTSGAPSGTTVVVACQGHVATYSATFVANGSGTAIAATVKAGDTVTTAITESATSTKLTFKDAKTHVTKSMTAAGGTPGVALVGVETFQATKIPNFKKMVFTACKIDGKTLKAANAVALDLVNGVLQIQTSKLTTTGDGFTETFKHA